MTQFMFLTKLMMQKLGLKKKTGSIEPKHTTFESYHILTALEEYGVLVEI